MSKARLAGSSRSAKKGLCSDSGRSAAPIALSDRPIAKTSRENSKHQRTAEGQVSNDRTWEQERQMLLDELAQSRSLNRDREERIVHLEQALDQLIVSLDDMKLQIRDQQFLEEQLAATEETANIQQQAIANLKFQINGKQKSLRAHQDLVAQLEQAQQLVSEQEVTIAQLSQDLVTVRAQMETLTGQETEQSLVKNLLQQTCQELEAERDRTCTRLEKLQQETSEMQEQILHQAKQASEYEAAIQYWRDRYTSSQRYASQLKKLLERILPEHPVNLADVLTTLNLSPNEIPMPQLQERALAQATEKTLKVDLPEFLPRRHQYNIIS